jgi:phage terminase large subunit
MAHSEIRLPNNWLPRKYQENAWRAREAGFRKFCLVWHRRAGKDDFGLHSTAVEAHARVGNYWHMLPQYGQARKAIWEAINPHTGRRRIDEAFPDELCEIKRETDMTIRFRNGSQWNVVGSDNYDSLVGTPPVGVIFSEWALAKPEAYAFLRPILAENNGFAMFLYTPRGPNHGLKTYQMACASPDWFCQLLTVDDTGAMPQSTLDTELREYISEWGPEMGKAFYQQEYYCSFEAAIVGAVYGEQLSQLRQRGGICRVPIDPAYEVGTMWDLGYTDHTAIWFFQLVGREVRFVDYYEAGGVDLSHYRDILKRRAEEGGYRYSRTTMYFPHDVEQHELIVGKSRRVALLEMGIPVVTVPLHDPMDGISAVRANFHRFVFDAERCAQGLNALSLYHFEWDTTKRIFSPKPVHDWTSHPADALRTGCAMMPGAAPMRGIDGRPRDDYSRGKKDRHEFYSRMGL